MKAKNDFKFIHIGYDGDSICCSQTKGIVIDRNTKNKYLYCYRCNARRKLDSHKKN